MNKFLVAGVSAALLTGTAVSPAVANFHGGGGGFHGGGVGVFHGGGGFHGGEEVHGGERFYGALVHE